MTNSPEKYPIEIKDLYKTLLDTRNFEISLFWQRCNYFLVLNTGVAFAFFNAKSTAACVTLAVIGFISSLLWFWVSLGSKFWQARWEQRLMDFEKEHLPGLDFFSAPKERIKRDAKNGLLTFHELTWSQRLIYKWAVKRKPSVSYSMIRLAAVFYIGWVALFVMLFLLGRNPLN